MTLQNKGSVLYEKLNTVSEIENGDDSSEAALLAHEDAFQSPKRRSRARIATSIAAHGLLLACYLVWTILLLRKSQRDFSCEPGPSLIYSPAREAVKYETKFMNNSIFDESPFKGDPRPEKTEAWRQYSKVQMVRVTEEELKALGKSSISLSDGSGDYVATLDVFHEIHCLNFIREYIHKDYYPNGEAADRRWLHVDHCLDTLRQIILCHGDVSVVTFDWDVHEHDPYPNFEVERECRNWDSIMEWTLSRQLDWRDVIRPADLGHAPQRHTSLPPE